MYLNLIASFVGRLLDFLGLFLLSIFLPFCGHSEIDHYFCDIYPLSKLSCTDTHKIGFLVIATSSLMWLVIFSVLMASYFMILYNVKSCSAETLHKALSTCSSHVTAVIQFFAPNIFIYIRPATTLPEDKVFTLFYTVIVPMLNFLIYTLRNMDMKNIIRKVWCNEKENQWSFDVNWHLYITLPFFDSLLPMGESVRTCKSQA